jgi:glycosyltransferase involved in cell wall biosynthesis
MNFILFSTTLWDWADGMQPASQLARELARRGHVVLFIQPRGSSSSSGHPSIRILSLADLGLPQPLAERAWHGLRIDSLEVVARNLLTALRAIEQPEANSVAIWFAPFDPFARLLPLLRTCGYHPVYYPQDDFGAMISLGFYRHNARAESYLMQEAEAIITLSEPVAEKMRRTGQDVHVIPDGINLEEYRAGAGTNVEPAGLLRGEHTLGFWGFLSQAMVDASMLAFVARARPHWAINLIGTCDPRSAEIQRLQDLANVRFLGQVPHARLREFAVFFDAGLIPAPDNDFSRGRDPLKVYEYLALYKPVICAHMPQLGGMPFVHNASTPGEFLQEIENALMTPVDRGLIDAFLVLQTWAMRGDALLKVIAHVTQDHLARIPPEQLQASADLPILPSFQDGNPGLDSYLSDVESDLEKTRQWARELEAQVRAKDRELRRLYNLLRVRQGLGAWHKLTRLRRR